MKYIGSLNEEDLKKFKSGDKTVIKKYLKELDMSSGDASSMASLTTGMRRIQYKFERANTPQKYQEAFDMLSSLVTNFPLKSKIIWKAVADAYTSRFGSGVSETD